MQCALQAFPTQSNAEETQAFGKPTSSAIAAESLFFPISQDSPDPSIAVLPGNPGIDVMDHIRTCTHLPRLFRHGAEPKRSIKKSRKTLTLGVRCRPGGSTAHNG
jgi:hypothetical protein